MQHVRWQRKTGIWWLQCWWSMSEWYVSIFIHLGKCKLCMYRTLARKSLDYVISCLALIQCRYVLLLFLQEMVSHDYFSYSYNTILILAVNLNLRKDIVTSVGEHFSVPLKRLLRRFLLRVGYIADILTKNCQFYQRVHFLKQIRWDCEQNVFIFPQ